MKTIALVLFACYFIYTALNVKNDFLCGLFVIFSFISAIAGLVFLFIEGV